MLPIPTLVLTRSGYKGSSQKPTKSQIDKAITPWLFLNCIRDHYSLEIVFSNTLCIKKDTPHLFSTF